MRRFVVAKTCLSCRSEVCRKPCRQHEFDEAQFLLGRATGLETGVGGRFASRQWQAAKADAALRIPDPN